MNAPWAGGSHAGSPHPRCTKSALEQGTDPRQHHARLDFALRGCQGAHQFRAQVPQVLRIGCVPDAQRQVMGGSAPWPRTEWLRGRRCVALRCTKGLERNHLIAVLLGTGPADAATAISPGLLPRARFIALRTFEQHIGQACDLRPVEFALLVLVGSNQHVTQKRLAYSLGVAQPNMTGLLRRLEERGLLERSRAEKDKRVQYIALTKTGAKLLRQAVTVGKDGQGLAAAAEHGGAVNPARAVSRATEFSPSW